MSVSRLLLFVRSVIDLASKVFLIVGSKKVQFSTPPQKIGRLTQFNNPLQLTVSSLLSLVLQILIASANHADYRPVGRKNRFMPLWKEMYDFKVGPQSYPLQPLINRAFLWFKCKWCKPGFSIRFQITDIHLTCIS